MKELSSIERRARIARIAMHDLCKIAKVSPATVSRWKAGGTITIKPLKRLEDTLTVLEKK